jgi:NAD-dependent SIR2 family protein deacetylase
MIGFNVVFQAVPNVVHTTLADLEQNHWISSVVTQNVDSLHRKGTHQPLNYGASMSRIRRLDTSLRHPWKITPESSHLHVRN